MGLSFPEIALCIFTFDPGAGHICYNLRPATTDCKPHNVTAVSKNRVTPSRTLVRSFRCKRDLLRCLCHRGRRLYMAELDACVCAANRFSQYFSVRGLPRIVFGCFLDVRFLPIASTFPLEPAHNRSHSRCCFCNRSTSSIEDTASFFIRYKHLPVCFLTSHYGGSWALSCGSTTSPLLCSFTRQEPAGHRDYRRGSTGY